LTCGLSESWQVNPPSRHALGRTRQLNSRQVWDLFEGGPLFRAVRANNLDDELHLAEMVALLGPPPKKFLERHVKSQQYWDSEGEFHSALEIVALEQGWRTC
jgi:hypothetical protein